MTINLRIYISPLCVEEQWEPPAPEANNETILLIVTAFLRPGGGRNAEPPPYSMCREGAYPLGGRKLITRTASSLDRTAISSERALARGT